MARSLNFLKLLEVYPLHYYLSVSCIYPNFVVFHRLTRVHHGRRLVTDEEASLMTKKKPKLPTHTFKLPPPPINRSRLHRHTSTYINQPTNHDVDDIPDIRTIRHPQSTHRHRLQEEILPCLKITIFPYWILLFESYPHCC